MSFNLLIVDDEPIICRGLSQTIPWSDYNVNVVAVAYDGQEAMEKIIDHGNIDIIVTDVKMPKIDGLQLAELIYKQYPSVRIIMISGYDEFAYAQKAIKLGVKDYQLKPVNVEELIKKVVNLTQALSKTEEQKTALQHMELMNTIYQQINEFTIESMDNSINHQVKIYPVLSRMNEWAEKTNQLTEYDIHALKTDWKHVIQDIVVKNGYQAVSIFTDENLLLTCIIVEENDLKIDLFTTILHPLIQNDMKFIWSDRIIPLQQLQQQYTILINMLPYLPLNNQSIYCYQTERKGQREFPSSIVEEVLSACFQDSNKVRKLVNTLFTYFQTNEYFLHEVVETCMEIMEEVIYRYKSLFEKEVSQLHPKQLESINLAKHNSYSILQTQFNYALDNVMNSVNVQKVNTTDWIIKRAENYIQTYYTSNIKVIELANVMNISPNYFSSLFKQQTGKTFNEYVNQLRMDKAKQLLAETPYRIHEIAKEVGFQEYKYFVEVFKRFTDITPTHYRKLLATQSKNTDES
ncbi:response regulator transcription factor [Virgibacillus salexigens]|uniref:response regulator transcription factor n=1 Tax=Virgibacillus salexigens TaxID=61016 RepID=UPI00190C960A|nr:response regulator [Virgibacillus salexigens]